MTEQDLLLLQSIRSNFESYLYWAMSDFECAPVHRFIIRLCEDLLSGQQHKVCLSIPPRHGKSTIISKHFPSYFFGQNPKKEFILASYSSDLAVDFGADNRSIMSRQEYELLFPNSRVAGKSSAGSKWGTVSGGKFKAVGVSGGITGRGGHGIVVDDPIRNKKDAMSKAYMRTLRGWFGSTLYTRLLPGGFMLVLHTRWTQNDLIGYIVDELNDDGSWLYLNVPAIALNDDPLGRNPGECLWDWYPIPALLDIKKTLGDFDFEALYQGQPILSGGNLIHADDIQYYTELPHGKPDAIVAAWDTASSEATSSDFSVCTVWHFYGQDAYCVNMIRARMTFPELTRAMIEVDYEFMPDVHLIERASSGISLSQTIKEQYGRIPVMDVSPAGSKYTKVSTVSLMFENGQIFIPEEAPWTRHMVSELTAFPNGRYDDVVDTVQIVLRDRLAGNRHKQRIRTKSIAGVSSSSSNLIEITPRQTRTVRRWKR